MRLDRTVPSQGDYDMRLRSYCTMFVEQFEETTLYKEFRDNGKVGWEECLLCIHSQQV